MFIHVLKKEHQPELYMPLRALFLVFAMKEWNKWLHVCSSVS